MYKSSLASVALLMAAFSSSPTYQLQSYGINGAATNTSSSTTYKLEGSTGQLQSVKTSSPTYSAKSGSIEVQQASVPTVPTLNNSGGTYYNKLGLIVNTGGNASDATYVVATSIDGFASTQYVQADGSLGPTAVFQTYTQWGGAGGTTVTGLAFNTTYQVKAFAMQGVFTQSAYSPVASSSTSSPSITFSVSPNSITLPSLLAGAIVTGSNIATTFATNAGYGGNVYVFDTNTGLFSASSASTITSATADLSVATRGYGVRGISVGQTSGGPLSITSPYDGAVNNVGAFFTTPRSIFYSGTPVVGGSATAVFQAKSAGTDKSATDYADTVSFIAAASF